ncbi:MAG: hypothetical protein Q8930_17820 [Bacillota bacterium]|nr:hypothetical protein [Bacillota bacterium]
MEPMSKFEFFPRFASLEVFNDIRSDNKVLNALTEDMDEVCLGHRQVGNRSYHIFFLKHKKEFCVYYHGGGTDAMHCSKVLDEVIEYINNLNPENPND